MESQGQKGKIIWYWSRNLASVPPRAASVNTQIIEWQIRWPRIYATLCIGFDLSHNLNTVQPDVDAPNINSCVSGRKCYAIELSSKPQITAY